MRILTILNQASPERFTTILGSIFEDTPEIATATWAQRPFSSLQQLHHCMVDVVKGLPADEQLALIQAHPDLASKVQMAEASVQEQASVGLDQLTPEEFERFQDLNKRYRNKFGFPFIIAVRNHTKSSILESFEQRLNRTRAVEIEQALNEIFQIAWIRLTNLVKELPDS